MAQVVDFEVTESDYWVAIAALVSNHIKLDIPFIRKDTEVPMLADERSDYLSCVPKEFHGTAVIPDFRKATKICYQVIQRGIIELTIRLLAEQAEAVKRRPIFVVAKDDAAQLAIATALRVVCPKDENDRGRVFCIGEKSAIASIDLTPEDPMKYDVVVTTVFHNMGYTFTQANIMVTSVYFSNQSSRDQMDGRLLRIGQTADGVTAYILHTGLLSRTMARYEDARSLMLSMQDIGARIKD